MNRSTHFAGASSLIFIALSVVPAFAGMTLTTAGTTAGFGLTTFADGFPATGFCCGPLGVGFPATGGVLVADYPGNVYLFPTDVDGQHAGSITPVSNFGYRNPADLASLGGKIYMTEQASGLVVQLNDNGTFNHTVGSVGFATGMAADAANGLLYISNGSAIYSLNPVTGVTALFANGGFDGLTLDAGAQILYAEDNGSIVGYKVSNGSLVFNSGGIAGGPDGAAFGTGTLAGNIFVNTNGGTVVEVNIATLAQTVLASGGSRGDFVTVDPNGTLLLSQTDDVLRLTGPSGGCFGTSCGETPEPQTAALMFGGLAAALFWVGMNKRRAKRHS